MRWINQAVLASAACLMSGPVHAQLTTGNDLVEACSGPSGEHQGFCIGYIMGLTEGLRLGVGYPFMAEGAKTAAEVNELSDTLLMYCAFQEVTAAQNVAVVKKYLGDNPAFLHQPARWLLLNAYQEAYPCP